MVVKIEKLSIKHTESLGSLLTVFIETQQYKVQEKIFYNIHSRSSLQGRSQPINL